MIRFIIEVGIGFGIGYVVFTHKIGAIVSLVKAGIAKIRGK